MTEIVYLNGNFIEKSDAKVSILDRGFLFGDSIYEVIPVYKTTPFRLSEHIKRLHYCLNKIGIASPFNLEQWRSIVQQVIALNTNAENSGTCSIYIQVSRGCEEYRNHVADKQTKPTIVVMSSPMTEKVADLISIKAALIEDIRWQFCELKTTSLLGNILLKEQAEQLGCQEAILHRNQQVTEGSTSNVFIVKQGEIYTPEKNHLILAGITRDVIIELAESASIKVHQRHITTDELLTADEVWISSSTREISPVTQINGKIIGNGEIGAIARLLHVKMQQFKTQLTETND